MSYLSAEKAEAELAQSIKKACSLEESAPKQKHVRSKRISYIFSRALFLTIATLL